MQSQQPGQTTDYNTNNTNTNPTNTSNNVPRPGTPPRPPYSPVTPVFAQLQPTGNNHAIVPPPVSSTSPISTSTFPVPPFPASASHPHPHSYPQNPPSGPSTAPAQPPSFATEPPPPVPISESENPDAIALRSAISILQLQKQQSLRDIKTLDKMKSAVAADPERFAQELAAGNLSEGDRGGFVNLDLSRDSEDDDEEEEEGGGEGSDSKGKDAFANLGKIPTPQNVVRMPPINWAKYQIVGESLDKMHAEQLRRPSSGEPRREESQRAPEHTLASPYRPLVDKLESPKKGAKNKRS